MLRVTQEFSGPCNDWEFRETGSRSKRFFGGFSSCPLPENQKKYDVLVKTLKSCSKFLY